MRLNALLLEEVYKTLMTDKRLIVEKNSHSTMYLLKLN